MINLQKITREIFIEELQNSYKRMYSDLDPEYCNIIGWTARLALEVLSNTDALYHNAEHTIVVTLAGQAILEGKHIKEGGVTTNDWLHYMISLLCHDIGYVKGVCRADEKENFATGIGSDMVHIPRGGTDVTLTPYHVDRGKLFVHERFYADNLQGGVVNIDTERIAEYIERTRFPIPDKPEYKVTNDLAGLVRAADLIGQLGDPNYLLKMPALFYEFEELGSNEKLGYSTPSDLRDNYSSFFWGVVNPFIQDAIEYLRMTQSGKQWVANLHGHVFASEHKQAK